ncbi:MULTISPECIES: hypothetical protein [Marinobacter]|uniref:hypothetical protein n=3 Tax=Pseudomonadati TaxID=3379134 RepID=UPI0029424278|nr:hypothetical protein [Marinobacter salarius]WOI17659.1 hypothetical protein R1T46_12710 [Marinobacter salarius]
MAVFSIVPTETSTPHWSADGQYSSRVAVGPHYEIRFDGEIATKIDRERWIFVWYGEANTQPNFERVVDLLESGDHSELWGGRGILIAINKIESCVYLFNDGYGSFPVYLDNSAVAGDALVSDTLRSFAGHGVDWVSFYQFLSLGYIFGPYSLFKGISRLTANSGLKIEFGGDKAAISQFSLSNFWSTGEALHRTSIDDLIDIFRAEAEGFGDTQVMMSGGWDSRLLLSVLEQKKPLLYTHGDLESREVAIVRDIAEMCNLALVERAFSPADFGPDLVSSYLKKNDSAMFTHWHQAGLHARENKLIITAGTFGEVLGGHYGTLNTLPGKKKYASLLMHMIGLGAFLDDALHLHDQETILEYLKMSNYNVFWFLESGLADELRSRKIIEESNHRLECVFQGYADQGMIDAQAMFERFYTEHRGGQYINLQLTNSACRHNFRNIFTNRDLLQSISSTSFSSRAHNKVNKEIIRKLRPELLDFPMAATLANARRPLLIQEGSRGIRKLVEKNDALKFVYRRVSRYGDRGFGWNSFRSIVNEDWIMNISNFLSSELWDHSVLNKAAMYNGASNMYPLFDMVSKAITLNYIISEH